MSNTVLDSTRLDSTINEHGISVVFGIQMAYCKSVLINFLFVYYFCNVIEIPFHSMSYCIAIIHINSLRVIIDMTVHFYSILV